MDTWMMNVGQSDSSLDLWMVNTSWMVTLLVRFSSYMLDFQVIWEFFGFKEHFIAKIIELFDQ